MRTPRVLIRLRRKGNTEAFVIGENVEVRRSPQAVACKKRYAVELGKPRCAPDVDNHEPTSLKIRAKASATEEPDAGKPHVRDCAGGAG